MIEPTAAVAAVEAGAGARVASTAGFGVRLSPTTPGLLPVSAELDGCGFKLGFPANWIRLRCTHTPLAGPGDWESTTFLGS